MTYNHEKVHYQELQTAVRNTEQTLSHYAREHEDSFRAPDEGYVTDGVLEQYEEGKFTELRIGDEPSDIRKASVIFERGTNTKRGNQAVDAFVFRPGESLTRESGGYSTELITFDPETGEAEFPQGIGAKRQKIAMKALRIIQDNFSAELTS